MVGEGWAEQLLLEKALSVISVTPDLSRRVGGKEGKGVLHSSLIIRGNGSATDGGRVPITDDILQK
ncbi:hypothetical protein PG995_004694 [Apiospora arundinis]